MGAMPAPMGGGPGLGASAGPMGQTAGPAGGLYGGGLLQMGLGGRDVLTGSVTAFGVLNRESLTFELGVDAQRRTSPLQGGMSNGVLGRATVGW